MNDLLAGRQLLVGSLAAYVLVVGTAWLFRSRMYATFRAVTLALHLLIALPLFPEQGLLRAIWLYLHFTVFFDALALIRPRLRSAAYRWSISLPGHYFAASTLLAWPWAILVSLGLPPLFGQLPYLLGLIGLFQSLSSRTETVELELDPSTQVSTLGRWSKINRKVQSERPEALRIVQLTDPHLGPFMPPARLRRICQRVVDKNPDLVLLTGDFLTMETHSATDGLELGLSPLAQLEGRVFACMGNHDHEAPRTVRQALESVGARLLIDEEAVLRTRLGPVQIIGLDFHFQRRAEQISEVLSRFPRRQGMPRLLLLHDPGAFRHVPNGEADLVLSGHTHGGQVGLVSFGRPWTVVSWLAKMPDHGTWALGSNRLYVHRGTGHYGFPFRLGVPAEESLLLLPEFFPNTPATSPPMG